MCGIKINWTFLVTICVTKDSSQNKTAEINFYSNGFLLMTFIKVSPFINEQWKPFPINKSIEIESPSDYFSKLIFLKWS